MKKYVFEAVCGELGGAKYVTVVVYAMSLGRAQKRVPQVLELEGYNYDLVAVHEMEPS